MTEARGRAPWRRGIAAVLAALGAAGAAPAKEEVRITVIVSQDAAPYQEALEGFRRQLRQQGTEARLDVRSLHGNAAEAAEAVQQARDGHAGLVLALGSIGAAAAAHDLHDVPIVAGLVLNADEIGRAPNVTAVTLEFPPETELRFLKSMLPERKNIGVLYDPAENQAHVDAAARVAAGMGLNLVPRRVQSPKDLPEALDALARSADVLWGIADQTVLNPQTVQPILLFSLRNRIPFVGLSETWVRAGALYALDRDYDDIGRQCGEAALRILQGTAPSSLPATSPRKVAYSVNLRTARMLKVDFRPPVLQAAHAVIE